MGLNYVIHGATGSQGAPVLANLLASGKPVTALTRRADTVIDGAAVRTVDLTSAADLAGAYRGADGVFVHLPITSGEQQLAYARAVVDAVRQAQPGRVVFSTSGSPADAPGSTAATVTQGLAASGVPYAVIQPTHYLENLMAPYATEAVREQGALPYPFRTDLQVSWASHRDIADVALALFERPEVTGVIEVGQLPGVTGPDLAAAFADRTGRDVTYQPMTPQEFGAAMAPLMGEGPAAGVVGLYEALLTVPDREISAERSAQRMLGITPRTTLQWLEDIAF